MKTIAISLFTLSLVSCGNFTASEIPTADTTTFKVDSNIVKADTIKSVIDTSKVAAVDTLKKK